jgi:signal transduction histidine kinase
VVKDVIQVYPTGYEAETGPYFLVYSVFIIIGVLAFFAVMMHQRTKSEGVKRNQILWIMVGFGAFGLVTAVVSFVLPLFGIWTVTSFDSPSAIFFVLASFYAITRYRLLDLRIVIRKSFLYVTLAVFVFVVYYLNVYLDEYVFGGQYTVGAYLSAVIIAPLFLYGISVVSKILQRVANKYFFTGLYDPQRTIKEFASTISQTLKLDEAGRVIGDTIQDTFRADAVALVLLRQVEYRHCQVSVVHERGFKQGVLANMDIPGVLAGVDSTRRQPVVIEEIVATRSDSRALHRTCFTLRRNGVEVLIPLTMKDKIKAAIVVGRKATKEAYTKEDIDLLGTLSDQAAIAVENARLYNSMEEIVEEQTHEITQKNVRLQELLKMKSEFLSIASHQLRTPLTAIRGLLAMQAEGDLDKLSKAEQKTEQRHMLQSANRLTNIVKDLLDAMELEGGHLNFTFQKTDLVALIREIADELKPNYDKKGILFALDSPADIPSVEAEPKMLREAFENVIDNAEKYTNKGSVTVTLSADDKRVTIKAQDTGIGIPETDKSRLFEKFSRGEKSSYQHTDGSGLGLFIAKNVISEHHGEITLESEGEGKGTTVTMTLPIIQPRNSHT